MAHSEAEEFQLFAGRIRPIYHLLFNLAHAITGNATQAEYALQSAMLSCWISGDASASRHGFRERMRASVIRAALRAGEKGEMDWNGLATIDDDADALSIAVSQESTETRRLLALRYGCGLSIQQIARITGWEKNRVKAVIGRFDARSRRRLPTTQRRQYERHMTRRVRALMLQSCPQAPEMASALRSLQADAADAILPSRLPARIVHSVLMVLLALLMIFAFWFIAVLMQPAVLQSPVESLNSTASAIETPVE